MKSHAQHNKNNNIDIIIINRKVQTRRHLGHDQVYGWQHSGKHRRHCLLSTGSSENDIDHQIGGIRILPRNGGCLLQDLYSVYGTLKEQILDDELFYNMQRVDSECGEPKLLGFQLTLLCGWCRQQNVGHPGHLTHGHDLTVHADPKLASARGGETDSTETHFNMVTREGFFEFVSRFDTRTVERDSKSRNHIFCLPIHKGLSRSVGNVRLA